MSIHECDCYMNCLLFERYFFCKNHLKMQLHVSCCNLAIHVYTSYWYMSHNISYFIRPGGTGHGGLREDFTVQCMFV